MQVVRWAQARFDSVDGVNCWTTQNSGGTYVPGPACNEAALAFYPRIPRYVQGFHEGQGASLRLYLAQSHVEGQPRARVVAQQDHLAGRHTASQVEPTAGSVM